MKKYKLINFCEFDKYAIQSYCAIHDIDKSLNLGDITKINEREIADFNMMVGGSPCQDFSVAGKQKGAMWTCQDCKHKYNPLEAHYTKRDKCPNCDSENIEKTRSSLVVEWLRILREKKPNLALYENVKNLVSKQFKSTFDLFEKELQEYGYNTYWKVLNAKDYGIPQNRERVYLIIIKKELDNGKFEFPNQTNKRVTFKDILVEDIDNEYYISDYFIQQIKNTKYRQNISYKQNTEQLIEGLIDNDFIMDYRYDEGLRIRVNNLIPTLTTRGKQSISGVPIIYANKKLRFIIPQESWRGMGFSDEDFNKAKYIGTPNTQLYKQAGNSIVVDVLYYIYLELYKAMPYLFDDLKLSSFFSGIGAFEKALDRLYDDINNNDTKL